MTFSVVYLKKRNKVSVFFMSKILVVEDDYRLRKVYQSFLSKNNYSVLVAENAQEALDLLENSSVDLMICDVMMPDIDGVELTRTLREAHYEFPILLATAKESFAAKQEGFHAGSDDYMVKPIDLNEMLLRIEALLRRAKIATDQQITIGNTQLLANTLELVQGEKRELLAQKEFLLLFKLASNPDQIFTRQQIMDDIWGLDTLSDSRTVDVHINKLRDRLRNNKDFEIKTIRGLGYRVVRIDEK